MANVFGNPGGSNATVASGGRIAEGAPVQIGPNILPYGPKYFEERKEPYAVRQDGINATIVWDYGYHPIHYLIRGMPSADASTTQNIDADPSPEGNRKQIDDIVALFNPSTNVQKLIIPSHGVANEVRLLRATVREDSESGPAEPEYELEFEQCDGSFTSLTPRNLAVFTPDPNITGSAALG